MLFIIQKAGRAKHHPSRDLMVSNILQVTPVVFIDAGAVISVHKYHEVDLSALVKVPLLPLAVVNANLTKSNTE